MKNPGEDVDIVEVENREISFTGYTERFGRAYWYIGVERKEGGIIEAVYFIPSQQPDKNNILRYTPEVEHTAINVKPSLDLMENQRPRNSLDHSRTTYCKDHDLVEESWCMPEDSNLIEITEYGSGIEIEVRQE